jgi:PLD-like domain
MRIEDTVRKHNSRTGFRIADYGEVGIPVWVLSVQAITLVHTKISAIEEFVLKALEAGVTEEPDISEFLGLERSIVRSALASLINSDDVTVGAAPGQKNQTIRITAKGKKTVASAATIIPEEQTFTVYFDGVLRKVVWYASFDLIKRRDLRETGCLEIPASPGGRPTVADLPIENVRRVVGSKLRTRQVKRDLLAIKSVRTIDNRFLPAVAIVYKSEDGTLESQIAFSIDGKLSDAHETAFSLASGAERLRIEQTLKESEKELAEVLKVKQERVTSDSQKLVNSLTEKAIAVKSIIENAEREIELSESEEQKQVAKAQLVEAQQQLQSATSELGQLPVRFLYVYDHPVVLQDALGAATERLLIISPWIRRAVVDHAFVTGLEKLLTKKVDVYIGYGLGKPDDGNDQDAVGRLTGLTGKHENFHFVHIGDTHAKVLVIDRKTVVITSFNWLSFKGDPTKTFRDEQGVLIQDRMLADQKFDALMKWFHPPLSPAVAAIMRKEKNRAKHR